MGLEGYLRELFSQGHTRRDYEYDLQHAASRADAARRFLASIGLSEGIVGRET